MGSFSFSYSGDFLNKLDEAALKDKISKGKVIRNAVEQYIKFGDIAETSENNRRVIMEMWAAADRLAEAERTCQSVTRDMQRLQQIIETGGKLAMKPEKALPFEQALKEVLKPHSEQQLMRTKEGDKAVVMGDFIEPAYKHDDPACMLEDNGTVYAYKFLPDVDAFAALGLKVETHDKDEAVRYFVLSPIEPDKK